MSRFIKKILLTLLAFGCLALVVTQAIYSSIGERGVLDVESRYLITNEQRLLESPERYDAVFIGSSVTFRQINSDVFDKFVTGSPEFRSYNLGNPGMYPMRSVAYLENFIDRAPDGLGFIFFELYNLDTVSINYRSPQIMRLMNLRNYLDITKVIAGSNYPGSYKRYLLMQYTRALVFKSFGFGLISYFNFQQDLKDLHGEWIANSPRGFYPKDMELEMTVYPDNVAKLRGIQEELILDPAPLDQRRQLHADKYSRAWQLVQSPFTEALEELIAVAAQKNIKLIFIMPPLVPETAVTFSYPAYEMLPDEHKIDLSDPGRYPELYLHRNVFDLEHVNSTGSRFLSRYLAEEFNRIQVPEQE
ncbi:MAG: hypothetical protein QGG46_10410 [Gammaproteobacteria bacterium]|jgi:hypothetical protein|nr:hypothetical protein [Gammaproteobacteria bacterium]